MKRYFVAMGLAFSALMASAQRIAVLNDVHVTPGNDNSVAIKKAIAEINAGDYDCVVVNGDLTNEGSDQELKYMHQQLSEITHPLYLVPGNHENTWSQSATKTFIDLWGNDRFATKIDSLVIVGMNCGPYMKMGDGHIKQEDLHWLKSTLDEMASPGVKVLSFNHYPIRKDDLDNYQDYIAVLEQYPVIAHINGHYHTWDRYQAGDIEAVMTRALFLKDTYGYSIIDITPEGMEISEKLLGQEPAPMYSFAINTSHHPTIEANVGTFEIPEGFDIQCVHADSASVFTRMAFDADRAYFGTSTGLVKAIDKTSGDIVWQTPVGASVFSRATVLADKKVAFPCASGITLVDGISGAVIETIPSPAAPYVADGLLVADTLYIQGGYKRFEGRKATDGSLIWSYDSIANYCQAAPAVYGDDIVFGAWDTYLRCINANTGELKWRWSNGKTNNLFSPGDVVPVVNDEYVIIVAPDRYMTAIDRKTGETVWRDNSHKYRESLGRSADGDVVYSKTMDGELVAVDAHSPEFRELWICDMGLGYEHAPCIVAENQGIIYAGSRRGLLTAVSPQTHQAVWQLALGSSEINGIDIDPHDGSVWVSLIEGKIYRIDTEDK